MNAEQQIVRRQIVVNMSKQGFSQKEIAKATGLTAPRISQMLKTYASSPETFFEIKYPGKPVKLSSIQQTQLREILLEGAVKYGFEADIWTSARVLVVLQETFGISYHAHHIPKLLRKLGFSLQKPKLVDKRQSTEKVKQWKDVQLPEIKKKPKRKIE